jgi:hypothetical protein
MDINMVINLFSAWLNINSRVIFPTHSMASMSFIRITKRIKPVTFMSWKTRRHDVTLGERRGKLCEWNIRRFGLKQGQ